MALIQHSCVRTTATPAFKADSGRYGKGELCGTATARQPLQIELKKLSENSNLIEIIASQFAFALAAS